MRSVSKLLKSQRAKKGFTTEEVACACDIENRKYVLIENGSIYPDDDLLKKIYFQLSIDEEDLHIKKKESEEAARKVIGNLLAFFSLLFVLSFFLKLGHNDFITSYPRNMRSGFHFVFQTPMDDYVMMKAAFILLFMQFGYYVYRFITQRHKSNAFNIMTILFSVSGVLFMYLSIFDAETNITQFVLLILLALLTSAVSIVEMILYPVQHDFLTEKILLRRFISIGFALVLGLLLFSVLGYMINDFEDLYISEYFIFTLWFVFVFLTFALKSSFYEDRLRVTLYLSIPPLAFFLFFLAYTLETQDDFESIVLYYCLIMSLPMLAVNIDFIIDSVKGSINHLRDSNE